ncbi:LysE family translocator [Nitratireductor thuwali]|uniref:Threonine efflux protein n=1 Tax=Nitratireductor thuwali TaxID=2267699 RepID=A0ABY5MKB0_9HYPH|nr:Threonine efflux protein [Nitratireductor thuwali]
MSAYLPELLSLMAIFTFAIVSPGADLAMVMRQSLVNGRRAAILTSIGIGCALLFHVSYTVLGLGLLISQSVYAFNILKWCGVAYLTYIGIQSLRAKPPILETTSAPTDAPAPNQHALKAFLIGFATNALNPKPVFFFLSIFSTVVHIETPAVVKFSYGCVMAAALVAWFVGVSIFMTTPSVRQGFNRIGVWINRAGGLVFLGLGLKLATEKAG